MHDVVKTLCVALVAGSSCVAAYAAPDPSNLESKVRTQSAAIEQKLITWRRDIHQHPELGDQEHRTAKLVADHLRSLGMEVRTGIGRTGVVGVMKGGKAGKMVALRADMDALPVKETSGLPFASKAKAVLHGREVDVMHACGHDAHTAILMAVAEVLASLRDQLEGSVMFIFQPAEEGTSLFPPGQGKSWGAKLMLEEGLFQSHKPDAVFALHVMPGRLGELKWRTGAVTASSDELHITATGKQGHGGMPWNTIDPIVASAQVINSVQAVVSRRANLTQSPAVVTIGTINGGSAPNIVPEKVAMSGTIRAYDESVRAKIAEDLKAGAANAAASTGAKAEVNLVSGYGTTVNHAALVARMAPVLERAADGRVATAPLLGASEDFSYYARETPGMFFTLGVTPEGQDPQLAAPNHNPAFFVDERALVVGTRALALLAVDFLNNNSSAGTPVR